MKVERELDVAKLNKLLNEATSGPWHLSRGLMGKDLDITTPARDGYGRHRIDGDGPICSVATDRLHFRSEKDHFGNTVGESKSWRTEIKNATADAELIVAAVNALPELLRRLKLDVDETAWLIEWPSDKYGPIRYWAAGEPKPVIDSALATRFARRADAVAVMGAYAEKGATVAEHAWMKPAPQKAAA